MEKKRILVIEDHKIARDIIRVSFENEYEILESKNSIAALNILESSRTFDLILLDLNMSIMNVESFLYTKSMMNNIKEIPVVIISVDNIKHTIRCFFNDGANAYTPKSLNIDELKTIVKNILKNNVESENQDSIYKY